MKFNYKLIEGPPQRLDWDIAEHPPTSAHFAVNSPRVANDRFKQTYGGDSCVVESITAGADSEILSVNTLEGIFPVCEYDGVLNMEGDALIYDTTTETNNGMHRIHAVPGAPGGVFRDEPDVFARRLELGQFIPANRADPAVGVDATSLTETTKSEHSKK
ncbi:hypothetical protein [Salinibaculum rarum]|uniref:hypothetical protein n=1 Tax=Salinibaculum rarum TaxID=3058903 RepID=UPI00265F00F8|nr:hypothetical protein [Salinibaculum sp. KK48]